MREVEKLSSKKSPIRVLVWSEFTEPKNIYPDGIHGEIAKHLNTVDGINAKTAQLSDDDQGVSHEALLNCDVLLWWGHGKHNEIFDDIAERVAAHVREGGMGLLPIHSGHHSKPFKILMRKSCNLGSWREDGKPEYVSIVDPDHPIAAGVCNFTIPNTEMYDEPFDVPEPDAVVFESRWDNGERFRSGCCWKVGRGRIFYFRPGHETYPIMSDKNVRLILRNGVAWAARNNC